MDIEAGKTLTNEEVIRELLELLKKNAMKEQANDVFEICSYVDGLEKKIDSMTEELTNMQNQIKEMQEDTLVNNAKKALSEAQQRYAIILREEFSCLESITNRDTINWILKKMNTGGRLWNIYRNESPRTALTIYWSVTTISLTCGCRRNPVLSDAGDGCTGII